MADSSWSVPFFPPQKRHIARFLRTINVGIGTNPPSLVPLVRRKPSGSTSTDDASPDDGTSSWICPAISPRSKGLACPVALYGEKTVPPKRSERRISPRRRHRAPNSGPNHRRSLRRQRCRTPKTEPSVRVFFKHPKRLRCPFEHLPPSHRCTVRAHNESVRSPAIYAPPSIDPPSDDESNVEGDIEFDDESEVRTNDELNDGRDIESDDESDVGGNIEFEMEQRVECDNSDSREQASVTVSSERLRQKSTAIRPSNKTKQNQQEFVISNMLTQNAHGLRRRARDSDGHILPNSPFDYTRYEHLITTMKLKDIDVFFVQETWLEGDVYDETINGYHVFRHNGGVGHHNFRGVAIVLSPKYYDGWKAAGARPPITTDTTGEFAGRFISLNIKLTSTDRTGKQIRGKKGGKHLALTLVSVYHPCTKTGEDDIYLRFLDTLDELLSRAPAGCEIIMGADVNSNIGKLDGISSTEFRSVLGPHGLPRRNAKGESLLHVYLGHHLRVMNTFFEARSGGPGHNTWTSNRPTNTGIPESHMLDLLVCSATLHKRIRNCHTTLDGLDSDHRAVAIELNLTSIKYKAKTSINRGDIDWRTICEEEMQRTMYNKYLLQLTSRDMSYENFCEAVVRAGEFTAVIVKKGCVGWYTESESILAPAIQEKNNLRHRLHDRTNLSPDEVSSIKDQLKMVNKRNHDLVELAKARWYKGICEKNSWDEHGPATSMGEHSHTHRRRNCPSQIKHQHGNASGKWRPCVECTGEHVDIWFAFSQSFEQPSSC